MRISVVAVVLFYVASVSAVTPVQQCPNARSPEELKQSVVVGNCKKAPCKLRKRRSIPTEFTFTPDKEVKTLTNSVNAIIVGLPFPFIGVDGTSACDKIFESDGTTKAGCPLKAGTQYIYKNHIDVLDLYPVIRLVVHWGLTGDDGKDVMCFQVAAKITN